MGMMPRGKTYSSFFFFLNTVLKTVSSFKVGVNLEMSIAKNLLENFKFCTKLGSQICLKYFEIQSLPNF
jgi:hypothetical protein